jgi:glycosyltransferase involved in cell wall biosynthesis
MPDAHRAGFRTVAPVDGPRPEFKVEVWVVLKNGSRALMGAIVAQRRWAGGVNVAAPYLVSVIITCYNLATYLPEAIESVLAQTHSSVEVVVIDDGSTDNTCEVAARYPDIRYIRQGNQGLSAARNTGIRRTNGSYLVFLDADDRLVPSALDTGLAALNAHEDAAFASGRCRWMAVDGTALPTPEHGVFDGDPYAGLLQCNWIGMLAIVMYRRDIFNSVLGFDTSLRASEDYDLNLRIARQFPICTHDHVVAEYRQRSSSMSGDPGVMLETVLAVLTMQRACAKSHEHRLAYKRGLRFWKRYYGSPLAHHAVGFAQRREWRRLLRAAKVLLRRYPSGLAAALNGSASLD